MAASKNSKTEKKNNKASKLTKEKDLKKKKEAEKKNTNKLSNGNAKDVLLIPFSSTESLEEAEKELFVDNAEIKNRRISGTKPKKGKRKQIVDEYAVEEKEDAKTCKFPMQRIRTIMRAEDPDLRVSEEAIFVVSKATVKFLEQFTRDAYACPVQDRQKFLGYKRLSYVVSKQRRYDFLSDIVPEIIKAEDALRERNSGKDGGA